MRSTQGVTGVLLYDLESLTEKSVQYVLHSDMESKEMIRKVDLQALRQELRGELAAATPMAEISVRDEWLLFTDPATNSSALLFPMSNAVKGALPQDPLNRVDRDVAFTNNYTSGKGTCPYLADDLRSGCVLDPNVVKVGGTSGRPFAKGRPCETATDHLVLEASPVQPPKPIECVESKKDRGTDHKRSRGYH
jgi:hypothetical protein